MSNEAVIRAAARLDVAPAFLEKVLGEEGLLCGVPARPVPATIEAGRLIRRRAGVLQAEDPYVALQLHDIARGLLGEVPVV